MSDDKIELKSRELCSDGTCIGIIGQDGRCMECGKNDHHAWPTLEDAVKLTDTKPHLVIMQ